MTEVKTNTPETKQNAAAEIKAAEKMLSAVPTADREFISGALYMLERINERKKEAITA